MDNCLLVPPGDTAALSKAIEYLESRPEERRRIGANARKSVEQHFTTEKFACELAKVIEHALARGTAQS
jgi:glycosyltransferase involved in cell wall biosynthesis